MRIAVSGGIASGKSTILQMLRNCGVSTVSADAIARDVLWNPGVQAQLMELTSSTEPVSPLILRDFMAQDDIARRAVNRIMHPVIGAEIALSASSVFEIPLLFETCMHVSFDAIWVAFCSPETQSKRLEERYGVQSRFDQVSWQIDSKVALAFADAVISTDRSTEETFESLLQEAKRWDLSLVVS